MLEYIEELIRNEYNEMFDQKNKPTLIKNNHENKEYYNVINIFSKVVDAKNIFFDLSNKEFKYVDKVFQHVIQHYKDEVFDAHEYNNLCKEIAIQLDMVAPYHKFCNSNNTIFLFNDTKKQKYRIKARMLIDKNLILSKEWELLKQEFMSSFYFCENKNYNTF